MEAEVVEVLIPEANSNHFDDESSSNFDPLKGYSSTLKWFFLDYSNLWRAGLSWSIFFLLDVGVPLVSHLFFSCADCDRRHQRPFDAIVQLSLSTFAALSFVSISSFARKYGLRRFLFLDKLCDESSKVRQGYTEQLHGSMRLLLAFVLPCFFAECVYKIWWFCSGGTQIPSLYNAFASKLVVCLLLLCSWLYRVSICFLVCLLFRLACCLQILRLEDFAQVFEKESDVGSILVEHLRIRRNLRVISHRFRLFILSALILVTVSQFMTLLVTTEPGSFVSFSTAGELALTSVTLVTGLFIILRSAAKITHRGQAITSLASKWHACATIDSFEPESNEGTPTAESIIAGAAARDGPSPSDSEEGDGDDAIDNTKMVSISANTISYQKRQALVTYFEHNKAGITVYGFMLDRSWLHTIVAIELTLTLWILNKTIGIS